MISKVVAVVALVAGAILSGCAGSGPAASQPAPGAPRPSSQAAGAVGASEWDKVVEAARKEGKVTFYATAGIEPALEKMIPAFKAQYGIEVEYVAGTGRSSQDRIEAEQASGRYVADVFQAGDNNTVALLDEGLLQPSTGLPNVQKISKDLVPALVHPEGYYYPSYLNVYGMLVNTNLLPGDQAPKRWRDLLDPKYRGKIMVHNPGTSGGERVVSGELGASGTRLPRISR